MRRRLAIILSVGAASLVCATAHAGSRSFVASYGSDANPCSAVAPCRTLATAYATTSAGGEIIALDSGGYGPVTLSKSIAMVAAPGAHAAITTATDAIRVDAPSISVVIRNWNVELTGFGNAVHVTANASDSTTSVQGLHVVGLQTQGESAVLVEAPSRVNVIDASVKGTYYGFGAISGAGNAIMNVERSTMENCYFGIFAGANSYVVAHDDSAYGLAQSNNNGSYSGFIAWPQTPGAATLICERCLATNTLYGIAASGDVDRPATVRVSDSTVFDNAGGIVAAGAGGTITSFGNNRIQDNTGIWGDGSFSSTKAPY